MLIFNAYTPFSSLKPRHQGLIKQAIEKHVGWLNENADPPEPYTVEYFLEADEPRVKLLVESENDMDTLLRIDVRNEVGGGPLELYIHARRDHSMEPTGKTISGVRYEHSEITGYGTEPDGTNTVVRLDPPKEIPYSGPEYEMKFKDTYELSLVLQCFDTLYDVIYNGNNDRLGINNDK